MKVIEHIYEVCEKTKNLKIDRWIIFHPYANFNCPSQNRPKQLVPSFVGVHYKYVTQRQLMRLFAVKLILSYEQKCNLVGSKFLKN